MEELKINRKYTKANPLLYARTTDVNLAFEELGKDILQISSGLKSSTPSVLFHNYVDSVNNILLFNSKNFYSKVLESLKLINGEEVVSLNVSDKELARQNVVKGILAIEKKIQDDFTLNQTEKENLYMYTSSIVLLSNDINGFYDSLYPALSRSGARIQGWLQKLKHTFNTVVGVVVGAVAGGISGAIIGGALGFDIGVEMGFYFSCEYIPALNSPQNCLECANGGFKNLTCQDCQAVYPGISC